MSAAPASRVFARFSRIAPRRLVTAGALALILPWAQQSQASLQGCPVTSDPKGDVGLLTGDPYEDPTRDVVSVRYRLSNRELTFVVQVVDLKPQPEQSLGDLLVLKFGGRKGNGLLIESSRRLMNTGTPRNSDYTRNYPNDTVKASSTWDLLNDRITVVVDLASASAEAGVPIGPGSELRSVAALTAPAITDEGTPAWADWAGEPGSNSAGVDLTLRRC